MGFFRVLTKIGAAIGFLLLLGSFGMQGAAQEAAMAAMALAVTLIPYAVFRVLQITKETERRVTHETLLLKALERLEEAAAAKKA